MTKTEIIQKYDEAIALLQVENRDLKQELAKQISLAQNSASVIDTNKRLAGALSRVEAERDAVVTLINKSALKPTKECKHYAECYREAEDKMRMMPCIMCDHWEWRGAAGDEVKDDK